MRKRKPRRSSSTARLVLEREQHPHRNLERNVEIVAAQERVATGIGNEIVRTAVTRRHLDEAKLALDAHFLDNFTFASNDRHLRLEVRVAGEVGGRGWRCRR